MSSSDFSHASCSASPLPRAPEPYAPPGRAVPDFPPIRAGGRRALLGGSGGRGRRTVAAGLAVTAGALAASAAYGAAPRPVAAAARGPAAVTGPAAGRPVPPVHGGSRRSGPVPKDAGGERVRAPVRIADAAAVALLRPGDRVDVLAGARVIASGVPVVAVPGLSGADPGRVAGTPLTGATAGSDGSAGGGGALVLLAVPRRTAAALSGAAVTSPLAVALC